jgi:hypothetical protein
LRDESRTFGLEVGRPIRRKRSELVEESSLRKSVRLALLQPNLAAILILFDGDDTCPRELAPKLERWAQDEARPVPTAIVIAQREYEAWFLATIESLRGKRGIRDDAESHPDPESVRGAKEALEDRMEVESSYSETADQAALSAALDLQVAYSRSRSFRRMVRAYGLLVSAAGEPIGNWPPDHWVGVPE